MARSGPFVFDAQGYADKVIENLYNEKGFWKTFRLLVFLWLNKSWVQRGIKIRKVTKRLKGEKNG